MKSNEYENETETHGIMLISYRIKGPTTNPTVRNTESRCSCNRDSVEGNISALENLA